MHNNGATGRHTTLWSFRLAGIIGVGILSRIFHTGVILADKYLGDALYAAMVYALLRVVWRAPVWSVAGIAAVAMFTIEAFQLTMIPARMLGSEHLLVRLCARLLGTHFSTLDLAAYAAGLACIALFDKKRPDPLRDPA